MKILHVGKFYHPDYGGIESVTKLLAEYAVDAGMQVDVAAFVKQASTTQRTLNGVSLYLFACRIAFSQPFSLSYLLFLFRNLLKYDIVHYHYPNILGVLCLPFIPRRTKLVLHWHSDIVDKGALYAIIRLFEWYLVKRADIIAVTSQNYLEHSRPLRYSRHKCRVVPLGIDVAGESRDDQEVSGPVGAVAGKYDKLVLSVGRLVEYKGFGLLIEAAQSLPENVGIVLVGGGPLEEHLKQRCVELGVTDRVNFVGKLSQTDLEFLLKTAYLFCLPSINRAEAFGVVLLEAMQASLPMVTSDLKGSGVSWVNEHDVSGLRFETGNREGLAEALHKVLQDDALHSRLAAGSCERLMKHFTKEITGKQMMDVYEEVTGH